MLNDERNARRAAYLEQQIARAKSRADAREARLALALKTANSPIKAAVEPLRKDAMDSAEQWARKQVEGVRVALQAHAWDREAYAPYPKSNQSRADYDRALTRYQIVHRLTRGETTSRRPGSPDPCHIDSEAVAKFIVDNRDDASAQYERFVIKLVGKIGDCTSAILTGNHVWSSSRLVVTFADKANETWTTKQIENVSVLGKYFPQWPSRKVKQ